MDKRFSETYRKECEHGLIVNSTMKESLKNSIDNGYKLKVSAVMNTVDSDTPISITPDDIQQNSFNIDRYVQTGNTFEIGSVCASELKFVLYNKDKFKGVIFEGAEVIVSGTIPVENSDGEWADTTVNLGSFTIDEKPKSQSLIQIVALDDMVKFDKPCTVSGARTMSGLISLMASRCGVSVDEGSLNTCFNAYSNIITVTLTLPADTDYLCRQVLSWLCQLALCNAYINVEGKLAFKNFTGSSVDTITADDRYTHTIEEKEIGVKELVYKDGETKETIVSWSDTETRDKCISLDFSDNPLFKEFYTQLKKNTDLFAAWKSKVSSFYYVPFSANIRNFFWLEPMDKITFNKDGTNYNTWIMHTTLCPGSAMKLEAKGECKTKSGYASMNPLTAQEQKILNDLRKFVTTETAKVTPREYQLIEFNKAMNAGMAMYKTDVDGVTYYHDKAELANSSYILVQNSAGIAWTDSGWNNGSPVWEYGLSSDGQTILSSLDAYSIRADLITVTDLKAFGATIGGWNIGESRIWSKGSTPFLPYTETNSYLNKNTGNLVNSSVNVKLTDYIRVTPKEKYIYTGSGINGAVVASVVWYDISKSFLSAAQSFGENITFTVPDGCYYARFQAYTAANSTEEPMLEVKKQTDEEKYTFFTPVTSGSAPVWVSGAESLDSYDSAGFILYGDGRVRMGGNQNEGYIMASDNMLHFYGGEYNTAASLKYSVGLVHDEDVLSFVGWLQNSQYKFYTENKEFLKISPENGVIKTNYNDRTDVNVAEIPIGLQHYHRIGAISVRADFGIGNQNGEPSALMATYEKQYVDEEEYYEITSRLEVFKNKSGAALVNLRVSNSDTDFTPLKFGKNQIWYAGEITVNGVNVNEKINNLLARVEDLESTVDGIGDYLMQLGG